MKKILLSMAALSMAAIASAEVPNGEYVIKNVSNGSWLNSGHSWNTALVTTQDIRVFEVVNNGDGTCKIKSPLGWWKGGDEIFIDGGDSEATTFEILKSGDKYNLKHNGKFLGLGEVNDCTDPVNWWTGRTCHGNVMTCISHLDNENETSEWEVISIDDMKKNLENASESNPVEASFFLKNNIISRKDPTNVSSWEVIKNGEKEDIVIPEPNWLYGDGVDWSTNDSYGWYINDKHDNQLADSEDTIEQVAEGLPEGDYEITYRVINQNNTPANLNVNGTILPVAEYPESDLWYMSALNSLVNSQKSGKFSVAADGKLSIKMVKDAKAGEQNRLAFKNFRLNYLGNPNNTGVDGITVDENAPVEYYNLQGVRVANPDKGIYIVKQGNKVTKVIR